MAGSALPATSFFPAPPEAAPPEDVADQPAADAAPAEPPEDAAAAPAGDAAAGPAEEADTAPQAETFTKRYALGVKPVLTWTTEPYVLQSFTLSGALAGMPYDNGIYLVGLTADVTAPLIYVGETDRLAKRWRDRLVGVYQVGLLDPGPLPRTLYIWFGKMEDGLKGSLKVRQNVEHSINRTLLISGLGGKLRNQSSMRPFDAIESITIMNLLPATLGAKVLQGARAQQKVLQWVARRTAAQERHLQSAKNLLQAYDGKDLKLTAGMRYELLHP